MIESREDDRPNVMFDSGPKWVSLKAKLPPIGTPVFVWDKSTDYPVVVVRGPDNRLHQVTYATDSHLTMIMPEDVANSDTSNALTDGVMEDIHYWKPVFEAPPA